MGADFPGSLRRKGISNHDIDFVEPKNFPLDVKS